MSRTTPARSTRNSSKLPLTSEDFLVTYDQDGKIVEKGKTPSPTRNSPKPKNGSKGPKGGAEGQVEESSPIGMAPLGETSQDTPAKEASGTRGRVSTPGTAANRHSLRMALSPLNKCEHPGRPGNYEDMARSLQCDIDLDYPEGVTPVHFEVPAYGEAGDINVFAGKKALFQSELAHIRMHIACIRSDIKKTSIKKMVVIHAADAARRVASAVLLTVHLMPHYAGEPRDELNDIFRHLAIGHLNSIVHFNVLSHLWQKAEQNKEFRSRLDPFVDDLANVVGHLEQVNLILNNDTLDSEDSDDADSIFSFSQLGTQPAFDTNLLSPGGLTADLPSPAKAKEPVTEPLEDTTSDDEIVIVEVAQEVEKVVEKEAENQAEEVVKIVVEKVAEKEAEATKEIEIEEVEVVVTAVTKTPETAASKATEAATPVVRKSPTAKATKVRDWPKKFPSYICDKDPKIVSAADLREKNANIIGVRYSYYPHVGSYSPVVTTRNPLVNGILNTSNGPLKVTETPRRVARCDRCMGIGHLDRECALPYVCAGCSGNHKREKCTEKAAALKCVHCDGNHLSTSPRCPTLVMLFFDLNPALEPSSKTGKDKPKPGKSNPADFPELTQDSQKNNPQKGKKKGGNTKVPAKTITADLPAPQVASVWKLPQGPKAKTAKQPNQAPNVTEAKKGRKRRNKKQNPTGEGSQPKPKGNANNGYQGNGNGYYGNANGNNNRNLNHNGNNRQTGPPQNNGYNQNGNGAGRPQNNGYNVNNQNVSFRETGNYQNNGNFRNGNYDNYQNENFRETGNYQENGNFHNGNNRDHQNENFRETGTYQNNGNFRNGGNSHQGNNGFRDNTNHYRQENEGSNSYNRNNGNNGQYREGCEQRDQGNRGSNGYNGDNGNYGHNGGTGRNSYDSNYTSNHNSYTSTVDQLLAGIGALLKKKTQNRN